MRRLNPYSLPRWEKRSEAFQWALTALLAVTLTFNAASADHTRAPISLALVLGLLACLSLPLCRAQLRRPLRQALLVCSGLSLWALVQSLPLPLWAPVHPVWRDLAETLGTTTGYLSVNPGQTLRALPTFILPFFVFALAVMLAQSEPLARRLWQKLSYLGAGIVVLCVLRQLFLPESEVFSGQALRDGQFSGVFINRNIAASAFGLAGFALLGTLAINLAEAREHRNRHSAQEASDWLIYLGLGSLLFLTMICLVLTRSRAGSLASLSLLLPCLTLVLINHHLTRRRVSARSRRTSVLAGVSVVLILLFLGLFGEPVLSRVETTSDSARWCTWGATLAAIADTPLLGTGLGTFSDIFPLYRNSDCDPGHSVWLRAHNSYLELYLVFGAPSLVFFWTTYHMVGGAIWSGLRHRRTMRGLPIVMAGAVVFVSLHSLVDFPLQIPGIAMYLAALMGAGLAMSLRRGTGVKKRQGAGPIEDLESQIPS